MIGNFLATAWGRFIGTLTVITLIGGIAAEVVGARSVYSNAEIKTYQAEYAAIKQQADADQSRFKAEVARQKALNATLLMASETNEKTYKAEVERQKAANAEIRQKAESGLERANAEIEEANSEYRQQQIEGEAEELEADTAKLKQSIQFFTQKLDSCGRPCKGRGAGCFSNCSFQHSMDSVLSPAR